MDIKFGQLENLGYLWLIALVGLVAIIALLMHRRAVRQFATSDMLRQLLPSGGTAKKSVSIAMSLLALVAIVLALVDVRWGKRWQEIPQKGIEVVFLLDVSRSMLAEDIAPNRLGRAKQGIRDMVDEMAGDRVGLVLFAGGVRKYVPLTNHYDDFKQALEEVGPHNVERGGSNLGEAITVAADSFLEKTADHKAIVLITDGEDHESKPEAAAKKAFLEQGIRIYTVGLGDMDQGARIPLATRGRSSSFLEHDGQQVWSKLNGAVLERIARVTEGAYIPAGTKQVDMAGVYQRFIGNVEQTEFETAKINTYIPRYPWFLGFALLLLMIDALWLQRRSPQPGKRGGAWSQGREAEVATS